MVSRRLGRWGPTFLTRGTLSAQSTPSAPRSFKKMSSLCWIETLVPGSLRRQPRPALAALPQPQPPTAPSESRGVRLCLFKNTCSLQPKFGSNTLGCYFLAFRHHGLVICWVTLAADLSPWLARARSCAAHQQTSAGVVGGRLAKALWSRALVVLDDFAWTLHAL